MVIASTHPSHSRHRRDAPSLVSTDAFCDRCVCCEQRQRSSTNHRPWTRVQGPSTLHHSRNSVFSVIFRGITSHSPSTNRWSFSTSPAYVRWESCASSCGKSTVLPIIPYELWFQLRLPIPSPSIASTRSKRLWHSDPPLKSCGPS